LSVFATGPKPASSLRCGPWQEAAGVFRAINRHGRGTNALSDRTMALIVKRRGRNGYAPFPSMIVEWNPQTVKRRQGAPLDVVLDIGMCLGGVYNAG
jgi:hypothetical protein